MSIVVWIDGRGRTSCAQRAAMVQQSCTRPDFPSVQSFLAPEPTANSWVSRCLDVDSMHRLGVATGCSISVVPSNLPAQE